jgi:hypothetical protein
MDTSNDQMVSVKGDNIQVLRPKMTMTREEAVRHACWILVLAGLDRSHVLLQLEAIENT